MTDTSSTSPLSPSGLGTAQPRDYFALMKPRVMSLVVFTAWVGLFVAPGQLSWPLAAASILCIAVGAGASGALNMWWEAESDALMSRTKTRPIPAGKLSRDSALGFGVIMSALSVLGLAMASNYFAAAFLAFTIAFYAVFYTMWLKRATPQNIVIGGAAGAFPPMVGYAAVTGNISWDSIILFLITFMWTPPHFWALALYKTIDYDKAGIPMMPNVAGAKSTRRQIFIYALALAGVCVLPLLTGLGGPLYGVVALALNAGFVGLAYRVWQSRAGDRPEHGDERSLYDVKAGDKAARNLFAFSLFYLFTIFVAIAAEHALKLVG
ncbi:heme o synthase [Robiginitomaculum antarcticum]|uniref:heme o synthase n=1 Tax=Robiginitomaculum antarcticum TaxID=437507 RepID=UPI00035FB7C2|nr:heme o synthase [Robiginitomaculum antarcticum]